MLIVDRLIAFVSANILTIAFLFFLDRAVMRNAAVSANVKYGVLAVYVIILLSGLLIWMSVLPPAHADMVDMVVPVTGPQYALYSIIVFLIAYYTFIVAHIWKRI